MYLKHSGLVLDRREGARTYYRLSDSKEAQPSERVRKLLFTFLREAFQSSEALKEDLRKLKKTIETGSCTVSEWKPYSALAQSRGADSQRPKPVK
jgi:hypothetical protein